MRTPPEDEYDQKDLARLNVEGWMVELLDLNPEYPHWGPHEDYMIVKGDGWNSPLTVASWKEFKIKLDDLNEVVHFYFGLSRDSIDCHSCDRSGYNPATKHIADTFYEPPSYEAQMLLRSFDPKLISLTEMAQMRARASTAHEAWHDKITQDEVDALIEHNRLRHLDPEKGWVRVPRTAEEVNAANRGGPRFLANDHLDHDGINRGILIETRATRLGVWGVCEKCDGHGYVFTADKGTVHLVLWLIHPRKGASRGVEVKLVEKNDLPSVFAFLKQAADRNAERFAKAVKAANAFAKAD